MSKHTPGPWAYAQDFVEWEPVVRPPANTEVDRANGSGRTQS